MASKLAKRVKPIVCAAVLACSFAIANPVYSRPTVAAQESRYEEYNETEQPTPLELSLEIKAMISARTVNTFRGDVRLRGERPEVNHQSNFGVMLSDRFDAQFNEFMRLAGGNARTLTFGFEVTVSGGFVNVMFFCNSAADERHFLTTVINSVTGEIVSLAHVAGVNGVSLINQALSARIAANPLQFSTGFTGITTNQNFYMNGTTAVLVFNEFELINARTGKVRVNVNLNDVTNVVADPSEHMQDWNGIQMIQLRHVVGDGFGYALLWIDLTQNVNITSEEGTSITITIGTNSYVNIRQPGILELEAAPQLFYARTYLPLSFFTQIMNLTYHRHQDGSITFSRFDDSNLTIQQAVNM